MGLRMDEFDRMSLSMYGALADETLRLMRAARQRRRPGRGATAPAAPAIRGSLADCP